MASATAFLKVLSFPLLGFRDGRQRGQGGFGVRTDAAQDTAATVRTSASFMSFFMPPVRAEVRAGTADLASGPICTRASAALRRTAPVVALVLEGSQQGWDGVGGSELTQGLGCGCGHFLAVVVRSKWNQGAGSGLGLGTDLSQGLGDVAPNEGTFVFQGGSQGRNGFGRPRSPACSDPAHCPRAACPYPGFSTAG